MSVICMTKTILQAKPRGWKLRWYWSGITATEPMVPSGYVVITSNVLVTIMPWLDVAEYLCDWTWVYSTSYKKKHPYNEWSVA